jgi:hypothetical protein
MSEALVGVIVAAINATSGAHGVYASAAERDASLTVDAPSTAYFLASPNRRIVLRSLDNAPFSVSFNSATTGANAPFRDEDGDLDGRTLNSQTEEIANGLAVSKPGQPEAVPLLNTLRCGNDSAILRIKRLRNSLMIFKRDGLFRLVGTSLENFRIVEVDPTLILLAPESLAELQNELYGLFDQGVMAVSESSARVVSASIDFDIRSAIRSIATDDSAIANALFTRCIGGAYQEDRKYFLGIPPDASQWPQALFVYCSKTGAWSKWTTPATCIHVDSAKRLVLGAVDGPWIYRQRRTFTIRDFSDFSSLMVVDTVNSPTSLSVRFNSPAAFDLTPEVGDMVVTRDAFGRTAQGIVTGVTQTAPFFFDLDVTEAQSETGTPYTDDSGALHKRIDARCELSPLYGGALARGKQYDQVSLQFAALRIYSGEAGFATDLSSDEETVVIDDQWRDKWGFVPWFDGDYVGTARPGAVLTYVPRDKQRASQLALSWRCANAFSQWRLQGVVVTFTVETEVFKR